MYLLQYSVDIKNNYEIIIIHFIRKLQNWEIYGFRIINDFLNFQSVLTHLNIVYFSCAKHFWTWI